MWGLFAMENKMESTRLIETIIEFKKQNNLEEPISYLQVLREIALRSLNPQLPPVFTEDQRQILLKDVNCLQSFLECEEGADAVELLIDSFQHYVQAYYKTQEELEISDKEPE